MADDRSRVVSALEDARVSGLLDFGRFVNDTTHLEPSHFDEANAYPVLLRIFPSLTEPKTLEIVARYLGHQRADDSAFSLLHDAFVRYSKTNQNLGWVLGDSLARRGSLANLNQILDVCLDPSYGLARQMVVYSTWRYKSDIRVQLALKELVNDSDVSLHAMSALRRTIGNAAALPILLELQESNPDETVRRHAKDAVRKIQRALAKQQDHPTHGPSRQS